MKTIIRMSAGLANRMFQYSYYLYLKKIGIDVLLDNLYRANKWKMEDIEWNRIFANAPIEQAPKLDIYLMGGGYDILSKIRRHYLKFTTCVIMPKPFDLVQSNLLNRPLYIAGAFQNAMMVNLIKEEAQTCFTFQPFLDKRNLMLEERLKTENSIAVHIRKGKDYLSRSDYKGTCTREYYLKAINYIKNNVANPKFYVFSDNWDWVHENIDFLDYEPVDWNPSVGWGNHFDMQLMSCCKHNIISNSTYSWWGAFLNKSNDKIVIGPKKWFSAEMHEYDNANNIIISSAWTKI